MAGVGGIDGLISGLDTTALIDAILEIENRPILALQERIVNLTNTRSAYETLEAKLISLKLKAHALYRRDRFMAFSVASSSEDIITARAGSDAVEGIYTVSVSQLAQSHQVASDTFSDRDTTSIGTGTLTISVGDSPPVTIDVDSSNSTLDGIAEAINDSSDEVQAMVVNVGGEEPSYRLLITGTQTGSSKTIVIDEELSGGTGLGFGEVGSVSYGTWNGTAEAISSGNYTGNGDATFSFSVISGGVVGTDSITLSYTDGGDISGTVTIPAGTEAGTEFDVYGGLRVSLGSGTVIVGETFSVDATSSTVQAPLNARLSLGSTSGGGTPIEIESAENSVTDLIGGVTLDLHQASASTSVTINVGVDADTMVSGVEAFIEEFNEINAFFNQHFSFDESTETEGGMLFGDVYAMRLDQAIRQKVTDIVQGLEQTRSSLAAMGIMSIQDGSLVVNRSELEDILLDRVEEVISLFSTMGASTDNDISFLFASALTKPSHLLGGDGYEVRITAAATRASQDGSSISSPSQTSPLVIDEDNNTLKVSLDGKSSAVITISEGAYESGSDLAAELETRINADASIGGSRIDVEFVDDGGGVGHFNFSSREYGSKSSVEFETVGSSSIYSDIGISTGTVHVGTDVAGTINGEGATGSGRVLTGNDGNEYTDGLQIEVKITPDELAAQGEVQGTVSVTKGIASRVIEYVNNVTDVASGAITSRKEALTSVQASLEKQIELIEARVEKKRDRILQQFVKLESLMSELQAQEQYMTNAITNLTYITNYSRSKK